MINTFVQSGIDDCNGLLSVSMHPSPRTRRSRPSASAASVSHSSCIITTLHLSLQACSRHAVVLSYFFFSKKSCVDCRLQEHAEVRYLVLQSSKQVGIKGVYFVCSLISDDINHKIKYQCQIHAKYTKENENIRFLPMPRPFI